MKREKPNTDFIFFVVCIISLICIAARIIFSIIQLNTAENADLIENAYCKVNSMDIDKQEQFIWSMAILSGATYLFRSRHSLR